MGRTKGLPVRKAPFVMGILFFAAGCFGIVGSWIVHERQSRAYADGLRVSAEIVGKNLVFAADGSSEYLIDYRFRSPAGQVMAGSTPLPKSRWDQLSEGDRITLAYLPEEPGRVVVPELGKPTVMLPIFVGAVASLIALLGAAIAVGAVSAESRGAA